MKTQICIVALSVFSIFSNDITAQVEMQTYSNDTIVIIESHASGQITINDFNLRTINPARSERLFIESPLVLKKAFLDILDDMGTAWIEQSFAVLSEVDLSVKGLAPGNYTLRIRSNQGSIEKAFSK